MNNLNDSANKEERPSAVVIGIWVALGVGGLCLYVLAKTNYNPTIAATFVTASVTIFVGVLAAYFGARTSLRLQESNRQSQIKGVIQAIYAELTSLGEIYINELGDAWKEREEGKALMSYYPISQDYFTIYNSNAALIGQIPDDQLRIAIVKAYLNAKSLVDSHLLNNRLFDERDTLRDRYIGSTDDLVVQRVAQAEAALNAYGDSIYSAYVDASDAVSHCLELIERSPLAPNVNVTTKTKDLADE